MCLWLSGNVVSKGKPLGPEDCSRATQNGGHEKVAKKARTLFPEGPARHLDVSGQKLSPHCLETIFDSQLPSPKLSPKMPPKLSLPHRRGHFFLFQNYPCGEGNCEAIERQKLSRGNFCPGTSRCLAGPTGFSRQKRATKKPRKNHEKARLFWGTPPHTHTQSSEDTPEARPPPARPPSFEEFPWARPTSEQMSSPGETSA